MIKLHQPPRETEARFLSEGWRKCIDCGAVFWFPRKGPHVACPTAVSRPVEVKYHGEYLTYLEALEVHMLRWSPPRRADRWPGRKDSEQLSVFNNETYKANKRRKLPCRHGEIAKRPFSF